MNLATAEDVLLIGLIVGARLIVPLLIFVCPLPAILVALVLDGIDQTLLHSGLSPAKWDAIEGSYQGYDKALDVYYLALAYLSTLRSWENLFALEVGRFLWYFRLVGVTLFEVLHDSSSPDSWRWLLLVFPNVFEYFFIGYEAVRLRWDPRRLTRRAVVGLAAFLWVFVKLPQEWWIHVAQLDFTDTAAEHSWIYPTLAVLVVVGCAGLWWAVRNVFPPKDWDLRFIVRLGRRPPVPMPLIGWPLAEKIALTGLLCISFVEVLPRTNATPIRVVLTVALFVALDSVVSTYVAARSPASMTVPVVFVTVVLINVGVVEVLHLLSSRFRVEHALFFAGLLSLLVACYDWCRPSYDERRAQEQLTPVG